MTSLFDIRHKLLCALCVLTLYGCGNHIPLGGTPTPRFAYTLSLPAFHSDSLRVAVTCRSAAADSLSLALPFVYADNPVDSFSGPLIRNLTVTNDAGRPRPHTFSTVEIGPVRSQVITIPNASGFPLTVAYNLDFGVIHTDSAPRAFPLPYVSEQNAFLLGSYAFAVPFRDVPLSHLWRDPLPIQLDFNLPGGTAVAGAPLNGIALDNIYELLFLHLAFGFEPVVRRSTTSQPYEIYDLRSSPAKAADYATIAAHMSTIIRDVIGTFGAMDGGIFHIMYHDNPVGLEASFGFASYAPDLAQPDSLYNNLLAHETIHHFVGVHCGDYDDPWWKEGVTNYLGYATAARNGLVSAEAFRNDVLRPFDFSAPRFQHPLSSEFVRDNLFTDSLQTLVYGKGAQVAMLLDHAVRTASANDVRLDEVTAELARRYRGRGFSRGEMAGLFRTMAGVDIALLLQTYVDSVGSVPDSLLTRTFQDLLAMGAFGPGGGAVAPKARHEETTVKQAVFVNNR